MALACRVAMPHRGTIKRTKKVVHEGHEAYQRVLVPFVDHFFFFGSGCSL